MMLNHDRSYDHLLDAEYEALSRSGREPGKIAMVKALRAASGLGLKETVDVLEGYMARRESRLGGKPRPFDDLLDAESGRYPPKARDRTMIDRSRAYDDLLNAEYEALSRSGREPGKIALIKALRGAAGLGLKESADLVNGYLRRRETSIDDVPRSFDDLIDAERTAATREDRPVNKIMLIKALREASGLGLKESKDAVEDYLRRRGGEGLPEGSGGWGGVVMLLILLAAGVFAAIWWTLGK